MAMRASYWILMVTLIGGAAFQASAPAQNNPQSHADHHPAQAKDQQPGAEGHNMMARCQQMMSQHEAMMQRMAAMDEKLDDMIAEMNKAKGSTKVDAAAKVVTEMAAQRKQMHQSMMEMNEQMMSHMMQHMRDGSDAMCPMMKRMRGMPKL